MTATTPGEVARIDQMVAAVLALVDWPIPCPICDEWLRFCTCPPIPAAGWRDGQ
jgi:hypothetical protein